MQHTFMTYVVGFGFIALLVGVLALYHLLFDRRSRPAASDAKDATPAPAGTVSGTVAPSAPPAAGTAPGAMATSDPRTVAAAAPAAATASAVSAVAPKGPTT
jgi:hypothetical protein